MTTAGSGRVILVGGGGHARSLADALALSGRTILGFTAPSREPDLPGAIAWLGDDEVLLGHAVDAIELVNGIGSTSCTRHRTFVYERLAAQGYRFATVTHPSAAASTLETRCGAGLQILAGAILGPGTNVGTNVLLNTRCVVEHDCHIGDHSHIATGAVVCGGCTLGERVHVGAGATVIQGVRIGARSVIAAGATVTADVAPRTLVAGVPATVRRDLDD